MQTQEIMTKVKNTLASSLKIPLDQELNEQASLREKYGLDSMSSLTFLMALEEEIEGFVVNAETLEEKDLENIITVTEYVAKSLGK